MQFIIENMKHKFTYLDDNKKLISINGFAFIDEIGHCIIIVYGESRRNDVSEYLK